MIRTTEICKKDCGFVDNLYETTVLLYLFVVPIVDYSVIPFP